MVRSHWSLEKRGGTIPSKGDEMSDHEHEDYGYEGGYEEPMPGEGRPQSNVLGIVGFVLSFCVSPVGLIVSLVALRRPPRGLAIGGVVVGVLGTVVWAGFGAAIGYAFTRPIVKLQSEVTEDYIAIDKAVTSYQSKNGSLPTSIDDLTTLSSDERTDPWGHAYVIETQPGAGTWSMRVLGPDGQADTSDDLVLAGGIGTFDLAFKFQAVAEAWNEAAKAQQQQQKKGP
jgi:hypothetical protein